MEEVQNNYVGLKGKEMYRNHKRLGWEKCMGNSWECLECEADSLGKTEMERNLNRGKIYWKI